MSDSDFVDVGDELVVKISGYPVGTATVDMITDRIRVIFQGKFIYLPLDIKQHDMVDGVAHEDIR